MGPENSSLHVPARLQAPMPCRLDWHDGGYHDMVQELKLNGMMPLAAESFCKLMRDAGRPASDAILPAQMLPFTTLQGEKCWRVLLDNMERPAVLSPAAQRMCLLSFSLRMFPWTQPSLARQILATGKLIGQFPDAGPGVCGRGFLEPGDCREADLQTAVQAVSHNGEIVFEAFVLRR